MVIRRTLAAALAAIALVVLTACAPDAGRVEGKDHDPAHYVYVTQCTPVGKSTMCHPVPIYQAERWQIYLVNGDDKGWVRVDAETYAELHDGDYYDTKAGQR